MEIETGKFKVQKDLHEKREAERKRLAQIDDVAASLKTPLQPDQPAQGQPGV